MPFHVHGNFGGRYEGFTICVNHCCRQPVFTAFEVADRQAGPGLCVSVRLAIEKKLQPMVAATPQWRRQFHFDIQDTQVVPHRFIVARRNDFKTIVDGSFF